jgi:hypothetical protein
MLLWHAPPPDLHIARGRSKRGRARVAPLPFSPALPPPPSPSSYSLLTAHPSGERQSKRISAASAPCPAAARLLLPLPLTSSMVLGNGPCLLSPATTTRHRSQGLAGQRARGMPLLFSAQMLRPAGLSRNFTERAILPISPSHSAPQAPPAGLPQNFPDCGIPFHLARFPLRQISTERSVAVGNEDATGSPEGRAARSTGKAAALQRPNPLGQGTTSSEIQKLQPYTSIKIVRDPT